MSSRNNFSFFQVASGAVRNLTHLLDAPQSLVVGVIVERDTNLIPLRRRYELLTVVNP